MKEKVYRQIKEKVQQQRNANGESVSNTMETLRTTEASIGMHKQHRSDHYPNTRSQTTRIATQNKTVTVQHKKHAKTVTHDRIQCTGAHAQNKNVHKYIARDKHAMFFSKKVRQ